MKTSIYHKLTIAKNKKRHYFLLPMKKKLSLCKLLHFALTVEHRFKLVSCLYNSQ